MVRLTEKQMIALRGLNAMPMSAYALKVSLGTMNSLSLKGMVKIQSRPGNMAFPRNAMWEITPAGRAAIGGEK